MTEIPLKPIKKKKTEIPLKPKKMTKISWNLKNDLNTPKTLKKKLPKQPQNLKKMIDKNPWNPNYDQNAAKHVRWPKYTWNI